MNDVIGNYATQSLHLCILNDHIGNWYMQKVPNSTDERLIRGRQTKYNYIYFLHAVIAATEIFEKYLNRIYDGQKNLSEKP